MTELSILTPVYNEEATVEEAIERALRADLGTDSYELVVVDDGSTDGTRSLLAERDWPDQVRVFLHDRNRGKGAAVRTALREARGRYSVILDADLEYDPNDLAKLLGPVREGVVDAAYGSRAFQAHSAYSFWYVVGNRFLSLATNVIYNTWITDVYTCFKLMPTDLMRSLDLRSTGFTIEAELTGRLLRSGARIYEVGIDYVARTREEGKKITPLDGIRGLLMLVRCRFGPANRAPA
jgi:glycosyltransferase involved in cell wall biosynthesis